MKKVLALLILFLFVADADAQLFGRRIRGGGSYCPGGYCEPAMPGPATDSVPDWAVKATCEVHAGSSGGTGGICHYDAEAKKCYILTCRHVVMQQTSPLYVKLSDGSKKDATFLGYSASYDLSLLEIDSTGVDGYVEVFEDEIYTGQEVYQVGYGINASRNGTINKRAGKVIKPSGYVGESSYDVSFMLISGDSGSPIFDAKTKKLMGVGWGHDYQHGKITGPKQCRDFLLTCLRKKNRKPPNIGGGIKSEPAAPTKPAEPMKPIEPAKPTAEFTQVLSKVDELSQGLSKLTDVTGKLAESVGTIGNKVTSVEDRLAAVEKSRCACPNGAGGPATTPPPSAAQPGCSQPGCQTPPGCACKDTTADLAQVKAELAKLKQTFKAGGTLNFRIEPKK